MPRSPLIPLIAFGATLAAAPSLADKPRAPAARKATKPSTSQVEKELLKRFRAVPGMAGANRKTNVFACCCDSRCGFGIFKATAEMFGANLPKTGRLTDAPTPEKMAQVIVRYASPR